MDTNPNWQPEIDLHCHILPDWDDGPNTLEEALAMCERAANAGMKIIAATPHVGRDFRRRKHKRPAETIAQGVADLQSELDARQIPIQILPAAEVLLGAVDVSSRLPEDVALTYGHAGKFALIESPYATWPPFGLQTVQSLVAKGVTPVIAHPERYGDVQGDAKIMAQIGRAGGVMQLTADSILGNNGKPMRDCCLRMLRAGEVSLIASDAHSLNNALPRECVDKVIALVGESAARTIFVENPRRLVNGERVSPPKVEVASGAKWQFWRK